MASNSFFCYKVNGDWGMPHCSCISRRLVLVSADWQVTSLNPVNQRGGYQNGEIVGYQKRQNRRANLGQIYVL